MARFMLNEDKQALVKLPSGKKLMMMLGVPTEITADVDVEFMRVNGRRFSEVFDKEVVKGAASEQEPPPPPRPAKKPVPLAEAVLGPGVKAESLLKAPAPKQVKKAKKSPTKPEKKTKKSSK